MQNKKINQNFTPSNTAKGNFTGFTPSNTAKGNFTGFTPSNTAKSNFTGFTLIEILVVISIIGFLATAGIFSFNIIRMQARDAVRANNIGTITRALALYMNDVGVYPISSGECLSTSNAGSTLLSADVISNIPLDPLWPVTAPSSLSGGYAVALSANFCYYYYATIDSYYVSFYLESNSKSGDSGIHVMTPAGDLN